MVVVVRDLRGTGAFRVEPGHAPRSRDVTTRSAQGSSHLAAVWTVSAGWVDITHQPATKETVSWGGCPEARRTHAAYVRLRHPAVTRIGALRPLAR